MSYEKRFDGRSFDEFRPVEIKVGVIPRADGSAMFKIGKTVAIAGVKGPRELHPAHRRDPEKAVLNVYYDMVSFSTPDRVRPGPDRRDTELSKVIREALEPALLLDKFPYAGIDLFVYILQANAGTRCAAISAASLALAHAGIPMRDLVSAVACGKVGDKIVVDLTKEEEDYEEGATDVPIAIMPRTRKITLLQMDGSMTPEEAKEIVRKGIKACEKIAELQREALKSVFEGGNNE
ncbi:exosome complex exonuclease Rrp41 [Nanoarchaeota archaeon]|nr:MAG: exosome complex exonuclease Rrp41 [Nanoarchaeota archaeon]